MQSLDNGFSLLLFSATAAAMGQGEGLGRFVCINSIRVLSPDGRARY